MAWSLPDVLAALNDDITQELDRVRRTVGHAGSKGDASETVWLNLFQAYLPQRYRSDRAHVVDSNGVFSDQIDVVVYDRQYSPFILTYGGQKVIPAESVYAVFEAKQTANASHVRYASDKVASVRRLHRTSLPIPHAGGTHPPKTLAPVLGGLLTLDSEWAPPFSPAMQDALNDLPDDGALDVGCIGAHGYFHRDHGPYDDERGSFIFKDGDAPAAGFLFQLIAMLQQYATVPMIDISAYARWL